MAKEKKNSKKSKIKEIKKEKKEIEKSELEKNIEKIGKTIEDDEFHEFLQPVEIPAPVLTKVETPNLEVNISSSPMTQSKEKETGIDYITKNEPQNEPKYAGAITTDNLDEKKYESEFRPPILRQTESGRLRQEVLTPQKEAGMEMNNIPEGIETNILEQKRREPFETGEKKYRKINF
ncbi:hypothetical protein KAT24_02815 [Candidatus Pacearchaeota archaeon]|nr:hypothetical protein [Candidatus Pacearchaeota archaeon]